MQGGSEGAGRSEALRWEKRRRRRRWEQSQPTRHPRHAPDAAAGPLPPPRSAPVACGLRRRGRAGHGRLLAAVTRGRSRPRALQRRRRGPSGPGQVLRPGRTQRAWHSLILPTQKWWRSTRPAAPRLCPHGRQRPRSLEVLAIIALAVLRAEDARLEALAVLLEASRLATVAALVVLGALAPLGRPRDLGPERMRIALEDAFHRLWCTAEVASTSCHAQRVGQAPPQTPPRRLREGINPRLDRMAHLMSLGLVLPVIQTVDAVAPLRAVPAAREALAVEFETLGVLRGRGESTRLGRHSARQGHISLTA